MASYDEARSRQFAHAESQTITVVPLTVSDDHPQKKGGFNPFCVCVIEPCQCPDGPVIWIRDGDVIESRTPGSAEGRADHREYAVRRGATVMVETVQAMPVDLLAGGFPARERPGITVYWYWVLWDATTGGFIGTIHSTREAAQQEAIFYAGLGHELIPIQITFGTVTPRKAQP